MKKSIMLFTITGMLIVFNLASTAQKIGKPVLKATIAGISKGDISKEILLNSRHIQCSDPQYEIIFYSLSLVKKGDIIVFKGKGNTLSESMKAEIKELEPGNKLIIEEIGAKSAGEKFIKLPDISLLLK